MYLLTIFVRERGFIMTEELKQKRQEQCMRAHSYGIDIEHILSKLLDLNSVSIQDARDIPSLQIDANTCEHSPFQSIKCGLFYYLALHPGKRNEVRNYIEKYYFVADMSSSDILSFVTEDDEIDGYTLGENGEEYLERMIDDFRTIVR